MCRGDMEHEEYLQHVLFILLYINGRLHYFASHLFGALRRSPVRKARSPQFKSNFPIEHHELVL